MVSLSQNQIRQEGTKRTRSLREVAQALSRMPEVVATKVRAANNQLAWIQVISGAQRLHVAFLVTPMTGLWRLSNIYHVMPIPKTFWKGRHTRSLGGLESFKWSFLPSEFRADTVSKLFHEMAAEEASWPGESFGMRWPIFRDDDHAQYAFSIEADRLVAEKLRRDKEEKEERSRRRKERLAR